MTEIINEVIEQELTYDGITMVRVSINYPAVSGLSKKVRKRVNAFYKHHANFLLSAVKKRVLPSAMADYALSLENSVPFIPCETSHRYTVTRNDESCLSLYRDFYLRCGKNRRIHRHGDTWNCHTGWFLPLESFFPHGAKYKKQLIDNARNLAQAQEKSGTHMYFENYPTLIKKHFSKDRFYLTGGGVSIFFDEQTLAPQSEGIPVFTLNLDSDETAT